MKKITNIIIFILGIIVGSQLGASIIHSNVLYDKIGISLTNPISMYAFDLTLGVLFGFIFIIIIPFFIKVLRIIVNDTLGDLRNITLARIIVISIGIVLGLIIAGLMSLFVNNLSLPNWLASMLNIIIYGLSLYICSYVAGYKVPEFEAYLKNFNLSEIRSKKKTKLPIGHAKILDTSVLIDGRIFDILKTGFVDGPIIIPSFVLFELQQVADSTDSKKRNRGRRGLEVLSNMQKEIPLEIINLDKDYPDIAEVDSKLLKLAIDVDAKIVTNDYNLNKLAQFQGIEVLNTNDLSNAVKIAVLPGEDLIVKIIKEGKDATQGVGYLEDGTMIVVENGRGYLGQEIKAKVTSVLQTAAGRMIFVKPV